MATLQNLCLSSIENSGKDLKEVLNGTGNPSLEGKWERHPVLKIVLYHSIHDDADLLQDINISTTIKITFEGIYIFELEREFVVPVTKEVLDHIRTHNPGLVPTQFKEIFSQDLSLQEEGEFKKRWTMEIEWRRAVLREAGSLMEQEIDAIEMELRRKERGRLLIDKVLEFVIDSTDSWSCTDLWILLFDPNTGIDELEMSHYEYLDITREIETIRASLSSGIKFIRSVAFC